MTNGINTRELILQILLEIEEEGKHSHIAIRNALSKYQFLPRQERAFITRVGLACWWGNGPPRRRSIAGLRG